MVPGLGTLHVSLGLTTASNLRFLHFGSQSGLLLHSDFLESCPEMQAGVAISSATDLADQASSRDVQRFERG